MVLLVRKETSDQGTFGKLIIPDSIIELYTGELPWKDNAPNVSCIPEGKYVVNWTFSPSFKKHTYQIMNVPFRSGIRIHSGNYCGDTSKGYHSHVYGCVLLGNNIGIMDKQKAVLLSRPAVSTFEILMDRKSFELEIKNDWNTDSRN